MRLDQAITQDDVLAGARQHEEEAAVRAPKLQTFAGKTPGQRVVFLTPNGFGPNGREYKEMRGKVVIAMKTHLVVNLGGAYGTPAVVDQNNFVR